MIPILYKTKEGFQALEEPMFDIAFPMIGAMHRRWHYPFYAAICTTLNKRPHPLFSLRISGSTVPVFQKDQLSFRPDTRLVIRSPMSSVGDLTMLVGKTLEVDGARVSLGPFNLFPIQPAASLYSRMTTFRMPVAHHMVNADMFANQCRLHLDKMGIGGVVEIPTYPMGPRKGQPRRQILHIKGNPVIGFTVIVRNLTNEESIALQYIGLGGRRHMGCGTFTRCR